VAQLAFGHTDRNGKTPGLFIGIDAQSLQYPAQTFSSNAGSLQICLRHGDSKFLSPHAADDVLFAQQRLALIYRSFQNLVAKLMAKRVVDPLETIQIQHEKTNGSCISFGPFQFDTTEFKKLTPIMGSGQIVSGGQSPEFLFHRFPLCNVPNHALECLFSAYNGGS